MLILIPFLIVILIIVAIDQIYYSDIKPKEVVEQKRVEKHIKEVNKQKNYIDKYIKK